jgi:hypothetical protein
MRVKSPAMSSYAASVVRARPNPSRLLYETLLPDEPRDGNEYMNLKSDGFLPY